jgi:hypothetical protein
MDNISLVETDQIDEKVQIIMRQTDYTSEKALEKLKQFNFDEMTVIRDYFGITEKKAPPVKSLNQEIYRQLRSRLDGAMKEYREMVNKGEAKNII